MLFHLFITGKLYGKGIIPQRIGWGLPSDTGMDLSVFIFELNSNQHYKRSWESQHLFSNKYLRLIHTNHWRSSIHPTYWNERIPMGTTS